MNAAALGAAEAAAMIARGELSSEALVRACAARIAQREPAVRAWAALDLDAALAQARACDRWTGRRGPLHGVPIGVKDVIDTADLPTAYGSPIYAGHRPPWDAACVALARNAGAIVVGKTATAEFASISPCETRNPLALDRTPGGSSSGSAAAVADFMVPLAIGTQTGGSTIRPAAFCGVVGYKPSFNRINRAGLKFSAESLDTIGLFGRSVEDVALLASALSGQPPLRAARAERPPVIGLVRTSRWTAADAAARDALEHAAGRLADAGASLREVELSPAFEALHDAHATLLRYEAARAMAWEVRNHSDRLSEAFALRMREGLAIPQDRYLHALTAARQGRQRIASESTGCDVLLTLSARGEAPLGLDDTGDATFNRVWTLLHVPCIHLPSGSSTAGLPLGFQVVGRVDDDPATLESARWIQSVLPFTRQLPLS